MSTTNDKFELHFKQINLDTNDEKNPDLVDLQNSYYNCNQKFNDFNNKYKTMYNELFANLNKKSIDEDLIKSSINNFNNFVTESQNEINACYNSLLGKQKELMKTSRGKNSNVDSIIKNIQNETNEKYKQYQHDIIILNQQQNELKKTISQYNSLETTLNDGLLTQTYTLFYIWLIILIIVVVCCFINVLNIKLGIINNILLIFTVCVALYFIYSNLNNYFV